MSFINSTTGLALNLKTPALKHRGVNLYPVRIKTHPQQREEVLRGVLQSSELSLDLQLQASRGEGSDCLRVTVLFVAVLGSRFSLVLLEQLPREL